MTREEALEELIQRVRYQHWDLAACRCLFCREARELEVGVVSFLGEPRPLEWITDECYAEWKANQVEKAVEQ